MFLVPDAAVGAQRRTINSGRMSLGRPGLKQRDQMASQTTDQCRQPRGQGLKASFPGAPRGKPAVLSQQGTKLRGNGIVLVQKVEEGLER